MSVRLYECSFEASTEAAEVFCDSFSRWLSASYVRDTTALNELKDRFEKSDLSEKDSFAVHFTGDYETTVTSEELSKLRKA